MAMAVRCLAAGIEHADPYRATMDAISVASDGAAVDVAGDRLSLADVDRVVVLGGGKGSERVASALVEVLDGLVDDGVVVAEAPIEGKTSEAVQGGESPGLDESSPVSVRMGDHPLPSARNVTATSAVRELAASADESTLVIAVVTGGASALLAAPVEDVGLDGVRTVTDALLRAGASIDEVNAVRKHVSAIKGGRLAELVAPARLVTVAVSDVVGDDPSVVGSGPTVPDESTYADALEVLDRYGVEAEAVRAHLEVGAGGEHAETPGAAAGCFDRSSYHVVASSRRAVEGAVAEARDAGYEPCVLSTTVTGEAREAGRFHAAVTREIARAGDPEAPPAVVVSAGETTVSVTGDGTGGPNQEFVVGGALELTARTVVDGASAPDAAGAGGPEGRRGWRGDVAVAAVDTDGRDGGTDAAGAVLAGDALLEADARTAARDALARNDATSFLDERDALLRSGPTGTNVNDLRVLVVETPDDAS